MRIFLSYAAEQRAQAEEFHGRLTNDGHDVFWDHEDLEAGAAYDAAIRAGIESCDAFVFLISPESVADESYARAELAMIAGRWPVPAGRVFPVMVGAMPLASVPTYLRSITIPQDGDPIASTLAAIDSLARRLRRKRWIIAVAATAVLLAVGALVWQLRVQPEVVDDLRFIAHVERIREGLLTGGDAYELHVELRNESAAPVVIEELAGDFDDERFQFVAGDSSVPDRLTIGVGETWSGLLPFRFGFPLEHRFLRDNEVGATRWRLRWTRLGLPQLSAWRAWEPRGGLAPAPAREIDAPFAARVRRLVCAGPAFAAALAEPPELVVWDAQGGARAPIPLDELPSCIASDGKYVLVGFTETSVVLAIDIETSSVTWSEHLPTTRIDGGEADLATRPISLAVDREHVWVATDGDGAGPAVLVRDLPVPRGGAGWWRLHPGIKSGVVPTAAYSLKAVDNVVWGVPKNVVPSHIVRFTPDSAAEVDGHDELLSFASDVRDVAPGFDEDTLLLCAPSNALVVARFLGGALRMVRQLANPVTDRTDLGRTWQEERLVRRGSEALAFHWTRSVLSDSPLALQLVRFGDRASGGELVFEVPGCALVDVAANGGHVWFAAVDENAQTHLLALR